MPMCYRGQVWASLIGNDEKLNSQIYEQFKNTDFTFQRYSDETYKDKSNCGKWLMKNNSLLLKDIPRTFPHLNKLFEEIHSLSDILIEVLGAFQNYRPDVSYV